MYELYGVKGRSHPNWKRARRLTEVVARHFRKLGYKADVEKNILHVLTGVRRGFIITFNEDETIVADTRVGIIALCNMGELPKDIHHWAKVTAMELELKGGA